MRKSLAALVAVMMLITSSVNVFASDIDVSGDSASGQTATSFTVTTDMLGGDLVVTIPDNMTLTYDSINKKFENADKVTAKGNINPSKKLSIKAPTSVTYLHEDDNSVDAVGTVTFGTSGTETWSAAELKTSLTTADSRDIKSTVPMSEVEYIGTYSTNITYNIAVVAK